MGRDHSIVCEVCGCDRGGLNDYECACDMPKQYCRWCYGSGEVRSSIDIYQSKCPCAGESFDANAQLEYDHRNNRATRAAMDSLSESLRWAGALCKAFNQGISVRSANLRASSATPRTSR